MSRPSPIIQLRNIRDLLRRYGYTALPPIEGQDVNNNPCIRLEFKAAVWASMNHTVLIRANSNPNNMFPNAMIGKSIDDSYINSVFMYDVFFEDSGAIAAGNVASHRKFQEDVLHALRGNMQNSLNLSFYAMGTEPKINGFNGAAANVEASAIPVGTLIPAGRIAIPGYLS